MRIWKTKTTPKAENAKETATTKTSPGRRVPAVAGLMAAVASVTSKFNLRPSNRVDNMASRAGDRVARVKVRERERKGKLPQLRLRGN